MENLVKWYKFTITVCRKSDASDLSILETISQFLSLAQFAKK